MNNRAERPVAPYTRVSTDEQRERATIETQRVEIAKYATAQGVPMLDEYPDDGWSGRKLTLRQRPAGARLLADAEQGRFDTVICYRVDRIGRGRKLLAALDELETAGVRCIISVTEARYDLKNPNDEFHLTMLSGVSGYEASSFLRRSKDATNRLAREGVWLGGIVPYGYHVEGEDKNARLVISVEVMPGCGLSEADVILLIYRRCVEDNWPCQKIADELNRLGVPPHYVRDGRTTTHGKRAQTVQGIWRAGRIRNMIANETYKGVHHYGKRSQDEEREVIERAVPAIVSVEMWERAQVALHSRMIMSRRNAKHEYLLRGLVKCSLCGLNYSGTTNPRYPNGTDRWYKCNGAMQYRGIYGSQGQKCPSKAVKGGPLEQHIWREVEGFLHNPGDVLTEIAANLATETGRADILRDEMAKLKLRVVNKQAERDTMLTFFRQGRIDAPTLDRQLLAIDAEERDLLADLALCEGTLRDVIATEDSLRSAETLLQETSARLDANPTFEVRRQIIEMYVKRILLETFEDEAGKKRAQAVVTYRFGKPSVIAVTRTGRDSLQRRA